MSELATLARPYAEAVFKRAKETGTAAQWSDSLAFIATVMRDDVIAETAENPKIGRDRFLNLVLDICQEQLDQEGQNFLKLLVHNNRIKLAPAIAQIYDQLKADDEGYIDVEIVSAFFIADEQLNHLTATLERNLKKQVRMTIYIDRALIGGLVVRAGDKVIDGSIKGQLQQLAKRL
jgi:F-type H+-transporting ATPase subunit delta